MSKAFQEKVYTDFLSSAHTESSLQAALREETTRRVAQHQMMTTPEQAQFLSFSVKAIQATRAIEVGVFTGYGSLAIAQALPENGLLVACDTSKEWPLIGQPYWEQAGVLHKIDLQIRKAEETLRLLLDEGHAASFDFIFIDADKIHYPDYFALSYELLQPEGLIVFDNFLWLGGERVADQQTPATRAIYALLQQIEEDSRVVSTLIPLAKGMLLVQKV